MQLQLENYRHYCDDCDNDNGTSASEFWMGLEMKPAQ